MINRQTRYLAIVLGLLLFGVIGFALFNQEVVVNGTATAKGKMSMVLNDVSVVEEHGVSGTIVAVSSDKTSITINVPKLEYPGAYVDITYTLKNEGTINTLLTKVLTTGVDYWNTKNSTNAIRIRPVLAASKLERATANFKTYYYNPGDSDTETLRIFWKKTINKNEEENVIIKIDFDFIQSNSYDDACTTYSEIKDNMYNAVTKPSLQKPEYDMNFDGLINTADVIIADNLKKLYCGE